MANLPPSVPTSGPFPSVIYEPLDLNPKQPSIRLAILQPAPREATIRITLAPATFASRPRYEALSYTWGKPEEVSTIELNGYPVFIRQNLWSALANLRDTREERVLWIDAICINQADVEERNRQVRLMAYIYSRAKEVIVWLGTLSVAQFRGFYKRIPFDEGGALGLSKAGLKELCTRPYWKRVWIVQEIGAATQLRIHWADRSEPWDAFFQQAFAQNIEPQIAPAMKLYNSREGRHGDSFLLANLMETCKGSQCEEPRDKVYGYVGIAHDCQDGSFPIDYSKSLFELYEDAVHFQYRNTKLGLISIVHFSQLVQRMLGGPKAMVEDLSRTRHIRTIPFVAPRSIDEKGYIHKVKGVFGGSISIVGPPYDEIIGFPDATRRWKVALSKCEGKLEQVRKTNEGFIHVILELENADLDRICSINPQFSWRSSKEMNDILKERFSVTVADWESIPEFVFDPNSTDLGASTSQQPPHLFATSDGKVGLAPHNARRGDLLFQFWDSDVVALVRRSGTYHSSIIGRAVIANDEYVKDKKFFKPGSGFSLSDFEKGIDLYVDIRTLQILTQ